MLFRAYYGQSKRPNKTGCSVPKLVTRVPRELYYVSGSEVYSGQRHTTTQTEASAPSGYPRSLKRAHRNIRVGTWGG